MDMSTKLSVRMVQTPRGILPMLCDSAGQPLPCQTRVAIDVDGEVNKVTVEFLIENKQVVFAKD